MDAGPRKWVAARCVPPQNEEGERGDVPPEYTEIGEINPHSNLRELFDNYSCSPLAVDMDNEYSD